MAGLNRRPRLLFLCQTLPYPPDGGVWIRTFHVLRLLARAFDVTALCFERATSSRPSTDWRHATGPDALGRLADVEVFEIPQKHSRIRYVWDHLRSLVLGRVYTTYLYESGSFRQRLHELLRSQAFDLVHADSLDLAIYLQACGGTPVVCVHHDVESDLLRRRAALERGSWRRRYFRFQARLMEEVERQWCERIALNVAVSEHDRTLLKRRAPASNVVVVPNGVDVGEFQPDSMPTEGIAYVGGTNPFPNLDALDFFCEEILPHVRATSSPAPIRWIGRASPEQQQHYRDRFGIDLTGYVEDARPLMRRASCHIVPLRLGGGTRLKILNAWALGKPVVSTSLGCEGLDAVDGENILIRNDPKEFAAAVRDVLRDSALGRRLGAAGRATVERSYSWNTVGETMIDAYLGVATRAGLKVNTAVTFNGEPRYDHA